MGPFASKQIPERVCFCFIPVVFLLLLVKQTYNISKMIFPKEMMMDSVWTERPAYVEAEEHYQLYLNKNLTVQVTSSHAKTDDDEAAKQKDRAVPDSTHVTKLEEENKAMKKLIEDLCQTVKALELRVGKLEAGTSAPAAAPAKATPAKKEDSDDDDDDDIDLFDSDEEEETEEEKKKKEELLKKYHEKKAKKPALIPKSSIVLDIKPWDDETDMAEMERLVRTSPLTVWYGVGPNSSLLHMESRSYRSVVWSKMINVDQIFSLKQYRSLKILCKVLMCMRSTRFKRTFMMIMNELLI